MAAAHSNYAQLCKLLAEVGTISSINSLLNWDQETYMPPGGAAHRAEQAAYISGLAHEKATSKRIGELIAACEQDKRAIVSPATSPRGPRCVREMRRDYDHQTKLPTELVAELARVGSQAQEVWKEAREKNDLGWPSSRGWRR